MTIVGMTLVDRKGRKFLFILGTSGIIVSLISRGLAVSDNGEAEPGLREVFQSMVRPDQTLTMRFDPDPKRRDSCRQGL